MSKHILTADGELYHSDTVEDELYHYGVPGMKWGVRKRTYASDVSAAKSKMKAAKKDWDKSFNKAYNKSVSAYSPVKKHREANDERWKDVSKKADAYTQAKKEYKIAKKSYKELVKSEAKKIRAGESFMGKIYGDLTDAHKIQAELKLDAEQKARAN